MELHEAPAVYEHVIHYDEEKQTQVRVTVNTFRSVEYLSVRKYYMDFNEEFMKFHMGQMGMPGMQGMGGMGYNPMMWDPNMMGM